MRLTTALDEFKRARTERFPEERRTGTGSFTGDSHRLVHIDTDGSICDYSDSLSGLCGIDRSWLGIQTSEQTHWFRDMETIRQHYYRDTLLVETEYDAGSFTVHQYDLTLGRSHLTHVELRGTVPPDATLAAFVTLAPGGTDSGVGSLTHRTKEDDESRVLEVYHRREHDYFTASTGFERVDGQRPEQLSELLADSPISFPRWVETERRDQTRLTGDYFVTAPFDRSGRRSCTTLISHLSTQTAEDREDALTHLAHCTDEFTSAEALRTASQDRSSTAVLDSLPRPEIIQSDLRVLDLLSAPSGGRIAAPELDPFYANTGGYGFVWFRDEAEVSRHLLEADDRLGLSTTERLAESARFLCRCQLSDGTWPHRVWADSENLAPGWANARVEQRSDSPEYQADQTATVTAFLAVLLRTRQRRLDDELTATIEETITDAVDALTRDIADNDLPAPCQNLWEDSVGQFTHTAATYVDAFAAVACAPLSPSIRERSRRNARRVLDGLDALWDEDMGAYVMRLSEGSPDYRLDAATLHLATALRSYDELETVELRKMHVDRLASHVATILNTLFRNPRESQVAGLVRYEGDEWRTGDQDEAKVWSVTTAMGALAASETGTLLNDRDRNGDAYLTRGANLYRLIAEDGPLTTETGYLAEQAFDDGTLDCATPLCWSHGLRLHTTALLAEQNALPRTSEVIESTREQPTWTTGEKYGVGTVADHGSSDPSRVWFTLIDGALTEARFPQVDLMNLRTFDFFVRCTDDSGYTARTHRVDRRVEDTIDRRVEPLDEESLLFRHVFSESGEGQGHAWTLTVDYATDPEHDAIVASVEFTADDERAYDLFAVANVKLTSTTTEDRGIRYGESGNYHLVASSPQPYAAETDDHRLVDERGDAYSIALAMAAESRFDWATVGTGGSDRLRTLYTEGEIPDPLASVDGENVALVGRFGTGTAVRETVALGFARHADTAAALGEADGALDRGYETVSTAYADSWRTFLSDVTLPDAVTGDDELANQYRTALMTLLAVEDKTYHGASIASPSVPWGDAVVATEPKNYGYNFVWSRDLYQIFTVFELVGSLDIAINQLEYIYRYQQDEAGFIPQNTYVNGTTRWGGEQMDNISFPQVMAYHLAQAGVTFDDVDYGYDNVRRSADYVARNGPATAQERWEEESGFSPSSIAAEIAGLTCASDLAIDAGHEDDALVWLALADRWARMVDTWTATKTGTSYHDATPYYTRVTRDGNPDTGHYRGLANDGPTLDERDIIDGGFLELVRLGILPAHDETIRNAITEVDETIRVEAKSAAAFYRYNGDGYGELARGDPGAPWSVEQSGKGRLWPLLTGERGEYELFRNDPELTPERCLRAMAQFANSGRMIAEQVWDRKHSTDYGWEFAEGTGSATPLAWSMAQYVRLAHGIDAGEPVETPAVVRERYREHALHEATQRPDLHVDTQFRGNELLVDGETTGVRVVIRTPVDSVLLAVDDGTFRESVAVDPGENQVVVAAADDPDLRAARTAVWQRRL